ncbi:epoxide hydrolase A-like [Lolium rigidum]|uniref:epoxide hydrolase A-like n=1 Tax=Lolium rigidum TaxID=89674 RepID=UPI001F5D5A9F|nr:epoxide hydrolase A-like [Lolium rigidum]
MTMEGVTHQTLEVNGIKIHVAMAGDGAAGTILFLHGFMQLWCSWHNQLMSLSRRGYRCLAPDIRGYGDSSAPSCPSSYTVFHLVGDMEAGAMEAEFGRMGSRFVIKKLMTTLDASATMFSKEWWGSTEDDIPLPPWLSEEYVGHVTAIFDKTGFSGAMNAARCIDLNWELTAPWTAAKVMVPTKFLAGEKAMATGAQEYILKGGLKRDVPGLEEVVVIPGGGQYIHLQKAEEVTEHIYNFFKKF